MSLSSTFKAKLGEVNHHLLDSGGNDGYEKYSISYAKINDSVNQNKMKVKFLAPDNAGVKYYLWDFGDGTTLKTINKEIEHKYNLYKKADWLVYNGKLPSANPDYPKKAKWTNVKLKVFGYDGSTSTTTITSCVYELTPCDDLAYKDNVYTVKYVSEDTSVVIYAYTVKGYDISYPDNNTSWLWELWAEGGTSAAQTSTDKNPTFSGVLGNFYFKLTINGTTTITSKIFQVVEPT